MAVSVFSVIMSIICASITLFIASFLISHNQRVRWGLLMLIIILGFIRLIFPVEISAAKIIHSWRIYPMLRHVAQTKILFGFTTGDLFRLVWMVGIGFLLLKFVFMMIILRKVVSRAVPAQEGTPLQANLEKAVRTLHFHKNASIAVTEDFSTAVSVGFLRPVILIPQKMLSYPEKELQGVIKHELMHFLRGDVGKQWALSIAQCLFWWNPVVHYLKRSVEEMLELECDEKTCRDMDEEERLAYLEAIKRVLRDGTQKDFSLGMGYGRNYGGKCLLRRVQAILHPVEKQSGWETYLGALVCVSLFILSYSIILQPVGMPKTVEAVETKGSKVNQAIQRYSETDDFLLKLPDGTYIYVSDMIEQRRVTEEEILKSPYKDLPVYEKIIERRDENE